MLSFYHLNMSQLSNNIYNYVWMFIFLDVKWFTNGAGRETSSDYIWMFEVNCVCMIGEHRSPQPCGRVIRMWP